MKRLLLLMIQFLPVAANAGALITPLWTARYNGLGRDYFLPAAVDDAGNSYVVGESFVSEQTFLVLKRNSLGRQLWLTQMPDKGYAAGCVVDPLGNVYVTGSQYNSGDATNPSDLVTWKFDPTGRLLWRAVYDPPDHTSDYSNGIGRDGAGDLYVVGRSYTPLLPGAYHTILKYDSEGHLLWARRYEGTTNDIPYNTGTLAINPHGGVAAATASSVISYSSTGDLLWAWKSGGEFVTAFNSVEYHVASFDDSNQLYVIGTANVDGEGLAAIQKFSATGEVLWTSTYRNPVERQARALDLEVDAAGDAFVALNAPISCVLEKDDDEVDLVCTYRPMVAKFSPTGELLWATRFSTPTNIFPDVSGLALDASGHAYLTARAFRFDATNDGYFAQEAFLGKCDPHGNQIWSGFYRQRSQSEFWATQPQVDSKNDLYLSAEFINPTPQGGETDSFLAKFHPFQFGFAPHIVVGPKAQSASQGGTASFSVKAIGAGGLHYQWRFNSQPVAGATQATLTLVDLHLADAGDYSVEVRSPLGSTVTPEARLTVSTAPP